MFSFETQASSKQNLQNKAMSNLKHKKQLITTLILMLSTFQLTYSIAQVTGECSINNAIEKSTPDNPTSKSNKNQFTIFPQIHTNLDGMVNEFVRKIYQDTKGNYWFGTNGNGIIRYDGKTLENISIGEVNKYIAVRSIVEDNSGNVWFGTSDGLIKYDGVSFTNFSEEDGLVNIEIWSLTLDKSGLIWVGTTEGVFQFDGKTFTVFPLPSSMVEDPQHMLSDKFVSKILEDRNGTMWFVNDGNGIFKYKEGEFTHLTNKNGLTDNSAADILEDRKGNIWIGTFYGGVSRFDGNTYTNFTQDGIIEGIETYNFCEDSNGNIWFSAENIGVYKYDGTKFSRYTTEDGLATNGIQSIHEDNKGHIWFGTWQGISLYDGKKFMNALDKEPWVK